MNRLAAPRPAALRPAALFASYALASLLLFRAAFLGDRSWFDSGDSALQSWPWLLAVANGARHLHPVLWEFGSQAGTSLAGELQPGSFYPPTWLLGLLRFDGLALCNAYVLLHFALAATGMHWLLRAERLSVPASALGAALFAFAGYLPFQANAQPNIFASLCWLPLLLLGARSAFAAASWPDAIARAGLAGLAGGLQIAAGHLQPFVHGAYAVMLCALVEAVARRSPRPLLLGLFALLMAVCLAAVPLFLADQYLHLAYRWYATGMSRWPHAVPWPAYRAGAALRWSDLGGLLQGRTLAEMDGSLTLTTAALPLLALGLSRRGSFAVSMAVLLGFGLAVGLGGHLEPAARLFFHLPLLSQLRTPIRAAILVSFAAAALAALGLDRLRAWAAARRKRLAAILAPALLACIAVQLIAFDGGVGRGRDNPEFPPLYYRHDPALDALVRLSSQGPLVDRIDAQPRDLVPPNAGDVAAVLNVMGQRATMLVPLYDYLSLGWGPAASMPFDRLGVRWVVSDHPIDGLLLREQGPGYRIYERPGSLSVLWTLAADGTRRRAPVTGARWGANQVAFQLAPLPRATRLVFAQPVYPGWQASVDGHATTIGQEEIFSAIDLPPGSLDVVFAYRPDLRPAAALTLAALLALVASLCLQRVRRPGLRPSGRAQRLARGGSRGHATLTRTDRPEPETSRLP